MQRKSSRKIITPSSSVIDYDDRQVTHTAETDFNNFRDNFSKDITLPNLITLFKYVIVCILLLPWIINLTSRVKENDYIPKLTKLLEESFTCPMVVKGNYYNCTCDDNQSNQGT